MIPAECWDAFELFRMTPTQWRFSSVGTRLGLDYASVIALGNVMGTMSADTMEYIRYLELGALAAHSGKELSAVLDYG